MAEDDENSMRALQNELAAETADKLTESDAAAEFLAGVRGDANALLHHLDGVLGDGGAWRCEQIVDPIVEEMIGQGRSFSSVEESGDYVPYCEQVVLKVVEILTN